MVRQSRRTRETSWKEQLTGAIFHAISEDYFSLLLNENALSYNYKFYNETTTKYSKMSE